MHKKLQQQKLLTIIVSSVSCGVPDKFKKSTSLFLPWMSSLATKGLTAVTPEIDCDQTAMGLPPVTSAVFIIGK
jgi:hypothetical protein